MTLHQESGHRIKTPSSKLAFLMSSCWEKNFIRDNAHNFFILSLVFLKLLMVSVAFFLGHPVSLLSFCIFLFSLQLIFLPSFLCRLNECSWRHIAIQILYVRSSVRPSKFRLTFFKLLLFEQVRFNYNQTWIIGALWEPSHYDALGGHMTRSKVTWQGQRSFEVKLL